MNYRERITIEPGKHSGKPCIRNLRGTVYDILDYLAAGMTPQEIVDDFPELELADIQASLAFAADRERHIAELSRKRRLRRNILTLPDGMEK